MGLLIDDIKAAGRYGDTELAHVNKDEKAFLDSLGGHTINPETGLPEYFSLGGIFKGAVKAVKGVVKGVGNTVKGALSGDIGSIAGLAAMVYTGGTALGAWGAGTAAAGGAGSAFAAGGPGFFSTIGSNLSNMATSAFSSFSGTASSGASGVAQAFPVDDSFRSAAGGFVQRGGAKQYLSSIGETIRNNKDAFAIAGGVGSALLLSNSQNAAAQNKENIAKNQARWNDEATAANYADSGYFDQNLGFGAPATPRKLKRPDGSDVYGSGGLLTTRG